MNKEKNTQTLLASLISRIKKGQRLTASDWMALDRVDGETASKIRDAAIILIRNAIITGNEVKSYERQRINDNPSKKRDVNADEEKKKSRHRYQIEWQRKDRAEGRDIGPLPAPLNPEEVEACSHDLLCFMRRYLAHRFPLPFSRDHLDLIRDCQAVILHGGQRAIGMARGSGKTTIVEVAALWALIYGHRHFLFVVAATSSAARQLMRSIQDELAFNDLLAEDFPAACLPVRALGGVSRRTEAQTTGGEPTLLVWTREEVRLAAQAGGGGAVIRTCGITGAIRGAKATMADGSQVRPDLCLIDDFQTRSSAKSLSQIATRLQVIASDVLGLSGPGVRVACLATCTIIYRGDAAAQLLDRKLHPEWQGATARLMISMPGGKAQTHWQKYTDIYREDMSRDELEQSRKMERATAYYQAHRSAMDDGAEPAWPARVAPGEISATQHAMNLLITRGEDAFWAEYQNAPIDQSSAQQPQLDPDPIVRRLNRIKPGVVPRGAVELTGFIDVGRGCLWYGLLATGDGFRGDLITYGAWPDPNRRVYSKSELNGTLERAYPTGTMQATWWAALEAICHHLLGRDWPDEDGRAHRASLVLIDAGYGESTDTVFDFCKRSAWKDRVLPSRGKGLGAKTRPMSDWPKEPGDKIGPDWRMRTNRARRQKEVVMGVNFWKSFVAARLTAPMGGPGCLMLPGSEPSAHEMLAAHLTAEKRVVVSTNDRTVDEWIEKVGRDNDLLDVVVGCHVAASIRGISFETGSNKAATMAPRMSFAERQKARREERKK
jgi:hypothetical protein